MRKTTTTAHSLHSPPLQYCLLLFPPLWAPPPRPPPSLLVSPPQTSTAASSNLQTAVSKFFFGRRGLGPCIYREFSKPKAALSYSNLDEVINGPNLEDRWPCQPPPSHMSKIYSGFIANIFARGAGLGRGGWRTCPLLASCNKWFRCGPTASGGRQNPSSSTTSCGKERRRYLPR